MTDKEKSFDFRYKLYLSTEEELKAEIKRDVFGVGVVSNIKG